MVLHDDMLRILSVLARMCHQYRAKVHVDPGPPNEEGRGDGWFEGIDASVQPDLWTVGHCFQDGFTLAANMGGVEAVMALHNLA